MTGQAMADDNPAPSKTTAAPMLSEQQIAALGSDERRRHMLGFIRAKDFTRIQDLARTFQISEVTVRSDLDILARDGSLRRVHGGVVAILTDRKETAFEERAGSFDTEKRQIAKAAVDLISAGDSIILDAGTTTMAIAHALADRSDLTSLTVFTPGLNVALALERAIPRIQVVVTGGTLRPQQHSLVEPLNTLILQRVRANIAFLGCNGFDPQRGIMAASLPDAMLKQAIIAAARRVIVVADASKFTQSAVLSFCSYDDVDSVLTAGEVDADALAALREAGVEVQVAAE
jgi:DeoR family transcriptional regulator of aga operon